MNILIYITTFASLLGIDTIWLSIMGSQYRSWLSHLFAEKFSLAPAGVFYIIYAFALSYLILVPRLGSSYLHIFLAGALFGLAAYGAYDLTNQATLRDWPIIVTIVDMAWGAVVTGLASVLSVFIYNIFK